MASLPKEYPTRWKRESMKEEAMIEFMSFYYSTTEALGSRPDLDWAYALPEGPYFGEPWGERTDNMGTPHVTRRFFPTPEQYKSTTQPLPMSSDEEDMEGGHGDRVVIMDDFG